MKSTYEITFANGERKILSDVYRIDCEGEWMQFVHFEHGPILVVSSRAILAAVRLVE